MMQKSAAAVRDLLYIIICILEAIIHIVRIDFIIIQNRE